MNTVAWTLNTVVLLETLKFPRTVETRLVCLVSLFCMRSIVPKPYYLLLLDTSGNQNSPFHLSWPIFTILPPCLIYLINHVLNNIYSLFISFWFIILQKSQFTHFNSKIHENFSIVFSLMSSILSWFLLNFWLV